MLNVYFHNVPLMALTATATKEAKEKLTETLRNPVKEISTVNRSNVCLNVCEMKNLSKKG
jgi:superfamily II DNA helicase RecQ